jgi:NAD(P)-dependent dehydrogenase (short-subunit alcohol dehydrogenase family)
MKSIVMTGGTSGLGQAAARRMFQASSAWLLLGAPVSIGSSAVFPDVHNTQRAIGC